MPSELQTAANRANSQRSTGPRSAEGKARVATNALKHGLTGKQIVLPGEDPTQFDAFRSDLIADLAPRGALEEIFAEKIVADAWRFRRALHLVAALCPREEREKAISAASAQVSSCETSFMQEITRNPPIRAINPKYAQIDTKPIKRPRQGCERSKRSPLHRWFP